MKAGLRGSGLGEAERGNWAGGTASKAVLLVPAAPPDT